MVSFLHHEQDPRDPEIERLQAQLSAVESSEAYRLAQVLMAEADAIAADPTIAIGEISGAIDAAVAKARLKAVERRAAPLIKARVAEALLAQRSEIDAEVELEVERAVATAEQRFREKDAPAYRAQKQEELPSRIRVASAAAILQIREENSTKDTGMSLVRAEPMDAQEATGRLKKRAKEIRGETRGSKILPYELLQDGDIITLALTHEGKGNTPYTSSGGGTYGYTNAYNSYLEARRLTIKLLDPEHGSAEVIADTWFNGPLNHSEGIRPKTKLLVLATNPDTQQPGPMLIKAAPVIFEALTGGPIENTKHDLWWVSLDRYRILS